MIKVACVAFGTHVEHNVRVPVVELACRRPSDDFKLLNPPDLESSFLPGVVPCLLGVAGVLADALFQLPWTMSASSVGQGITNIRAKEFDIRVFDVVSCHFGEMRHGGR